MATAASDYDFTLLGDRYSTRVGARENGGGGQDNVSVVSSTGESSRSISLQCYSSNRSYEANPEREGKRRAVAYLEVAGDDNRIMATVSVVSRSSSNSVVGRNNIVSDDALRVSVTYTRFARGATSDLSLLSNDRFRSDEFELACRLQDVLSSAVLRERITSGMTVEVDLLILKSGEGELAHAITCASMALAHASIPMRDVVTAVQLGAVGDRLVLDPCADEKQQCSSSMTIAALPAINQIVGVYMEGDFMTEAKDNGAYTGDLLQKAFSLGMSSCNQMRFAKDAHNIKGEHAAPHIQAMLDWRCNTEWT